jgi:spore germination protein YaaH/flagellar hook assembly protein FlgD
MAFLPPPVSTVDRSFAAGLVTRGQAAARGGQRGAPLPGLPFAHRRASTLASAALAATMLAGLLPLPAAASGPDPEAGPAGQPSIAYLEAMAHEQDRIDFQPGGLVTIPFTPRADDRWPIDGRPPVALPAGLVAGRGMVLAPDAVPWAALEPDGRSGAPVPRTGSATPDAPVDAAAGDPAVPATGASFVRPTEPQADLAAASGLRRQVFGFLPYWELSGAASGLNYDVLSTIAYFSVGANARGDLRKRNADGSVTTGWGGWTSSSMTKVINEAHKRGTRVVLTLSVFAWTSSQAEVQRAILGSANARTNLARQAAAAVRDRGADGINLDFEPLASGYADEFTAFLRTVRSELNKVRKGYQLTYDTTGFAGNYPLEDSVGSGAADAIFVMGYDYRTAGSSTAGSIDPVTGPRYDLTDTVRAFTARVPASRVILGLPWYGRAWSTTTSDVRSPTRSNQAKYGYSTAVTYDNLPGLIADHGRRWDPVERSPYVAYRRTNCTSTYGCVTSWRQVYYDDKASLKERLAVVNDYGLRGAGIWALGYDGGHSELYRAFAESFLVDKSAPQAGIRILAKIQGDEGFVVGWAATDTSRVVSYDVQVSRNGGAWTTWLTGTRATSDVWLGATGAGYAFRVRARDSKGNTGSWNVTSTWDNSPALEKGGFGRVTLDGLSYRTGPDTSAARLGRLDAGTIVAVTSGPVSSDGYTWYEITTPILEWSPVTFVERGVWIAVASATDTFVAPYRAPNSTTVDAGIAGLDFGTGATALGTTPEALAQRAFSPNGDDSGDGIRLRWTSATAMDGLVLNVLRVNGRLLGSVDVPVTGAGSRAWEWNGRVGGASVPDGRYVLQLVGRAGSRTYSAPSARPTTAVQVERYAVTADTVPPVMTSKSVSSRLISPNGDGLLDSAKMAMTATGATHWTARVTNAAGQTVRSRSGTGGSARLTWKGTDNSGRMLADGRYTATLAAWDDAGNAATKSWAITLDTAGPRITPVVAPSAFSPNGDGVSDQALIGWTADEPGSGTVQLKRGTTTVRTWRVPAATSWSVPWDGRLADGSRVPDGRYTVRVKLTDAAGNTRTATTSVVVDRTASSLRWSQDFYPQDGDDLRPTARLSWRLARSASMTLRLYDDQGSLVRTVWSDRLKKAGTRAWTWNGRRADGTLVPQGRYTARLTVTSPWSTQELTQAVTVAGFSVTASAPKVYPGQTLTIRATSIEPLAGKPIVVFKQPGLAAIKVTATRLANGTYKAVFTVKAGSTGAAAVRVRGTDSAGGTNTTSISVRIGAR